VLLIDRSSNLHSAVRRAIFELQLIAAVKATKFCIMITHTSENSREDPTLPAIDTKEEIYLKGLLICRSMVIYFVDVCALSV
jgi:hypothetical protein